MRRTVLKFIVKCEGSKDDKVREIIVFINRLAQMIVKIRIMVQRNFNYPQFYQLHSTESGMRIMPFKFKSKRTCE